MKKIFLSILITLATINTVNADAICKDGWKSTSEGSGTCSWHGGVCSWKPNYTYRSTSNTFNSDHNHGYDNCYSDSGSGGGVSDQAIIAAGVAALIFYDASQVKSINLNQYKLRCNISKEN